MDTRNNITPLPGIQQPHIAHAHEWQNKFNDYRERRAFVRKYAWSIPTPEFAQAIANLKQPLIEIGGGTGYWKWYLEQFGIDVLSFDIAPYENSYLSYQWAEVKKGSIEKIAQYPDRTLFMCWMPHDMPVAYKALKAYTGEYLVYVGEGKYGCTADDAFYDLIEAEWEEVFHQYPPNWTGIHSNDWIYRRK